MYYLRLGLCHDNGGDSNDGDVDPLWESIISEWWIVTICYASDEKEKQKMLVWGGGGGNVLADVDAEISERNESSCQRSASDAQSDSFSAKAFS